MQYGKIIFLKILAEMNDFLKHPVNDMKLHTIFYFFNGPNKLGKEIQISKTNFNLLNSNNQQKYIKISF